MDVSPDSTKLHFSCKEGTQKLICFIKFGSYLGQKWHDVDHLGAVYSIRSSSNHPYISEEGYMTLEEQCMSLIVAHPRISGAERVPDIWYFAWNLRVVFGRKWDDVDHKVLVDDDRSSSNHPYRSEEGGYWSLKQQCVSLLDAHYPISCTERIPKSDIFHEIWELFSVERTRCGPYGACRCCH